MSVLELLHQHGAWRAIDVQFAKFIGDKHLSATTNTLANNIATKNNSATNNNVANNEIKDIAIAWLACALSHELGQGNTCLNLFQRSPLVSLELQKYLSLLDGDNQNTCMESIQQVQTVDWLAVAQQSPLMTVITAESEINSLPKTPFVLDNGRLYLTRFWGYETYTAKALLQRISNPLQVLAKDTRTQAALLDQLFEDTLDGINWQKIAAAIAMSRQFSVISGGPGTGKTTTVVKLLAALVAPALVANDNLPNDKLPNDKPPRIQLVAPTGKAAARLTESIGSAIDGLAIDPEIKSRIPRKASTIHKILGARHNTKAYRHHKHNRLHLDVLVVDEASMVDLPMMSQLLEALPDDAKLILLGDKDQLSSVEAGSVLSDIFQTYQDAYSAEFCEHLTQLTGYKLSKIQPNLTNKQDQKDEKDSKDEKDQQNQASPIADSICVLRKSYRFNENSGIGQLAQKVNEGQVHEAIGVLHQPDFSDVMWHQTSDDLLALMLDGYQAYIEQINQPFSDEISAQVRRVHQKFSQIRLLCAIRDSEHGVLAMNQSIEQALMAKKLLSNNNHDTWYIGKPIMISRNDTRLELYNGDIGICLQDNASKQLRVYFEMSDGSIKGFLPSRLHHYELAFAMTIHKSQGSEFSHTVILLPQVYSPVLTRELVYTGITRGKQKLTLFSGQDVLEKAINSKTQRVSGLAERLSGTNSTEYDH